MTALVCASAVLKSAGIRRAVFCDRSRLELKVSPSILLPYLRLCWLNDRGRFDFSAHEPYLVNHFSNEFLFTQKHALAKRLLAFQHKHRTRILHPDTLDLATSEGVNGLLARLTGGVEDLWIIKPVDDSSGRGISVIRNLRELNDRYCTDMVEDELTSSWSMPGFLAQRYMTRPLLLDKGFKFNTRVYLFVAQVNPPLVYWHPGYITKAIAPFNLQDTSLSNLYAHVSNTRIQKQHPDFAAKKHLQKWTWSEFKHHVLSERLCGPFLASADDWDLHVESVIMAKLAALFLSVEPELDASRGQFALYGVDFLFEGNGEPLLIECNKAPSHSASHRDPSSEEARLVPALVDEVLSVELARLSHENSVFDSNSKVPIHLFRKVDLTVLARKDPALFGYGQ